MLDKPHKLVYHTHMENTRKLKITFEYNDREFSASIHEDSNISEVCEALKGLLIASGFHPDTVTEYIGEV